MTEPPRDFYFERLMERALELKAKHQGDHGTYLIELNKLLIQTARNEKERKDWEVRLKETQTLQRLGVFGPNEDDEREEVIKQVRAKLKARHPFVKIHVLHAGPRSTRHWLVTWTNGPLETEIKELVAPFARKDLKFEYYRKSADEAR